MASSLPRIETVTPAAAIPGGTLEIRGVSLAGTGYSQPEVEVGSLAARLVVSARRRLVVKVPEDAESDVVQVFTAAGGSAPGQFSLGRMLADEVHPVANPVVDRSGNIFTTFSGQRGKKVPVSIFKISSGGTVSAFLSGIVNPTGLALKANGTLLVSSRHDGTIYAVSPSAEVEVFAEGMGVATGLAVDSADNVYVGDRTGTVFKINPKREIFVYATLEPSVAAFHLAFCEAEQLLYVSAPSTSSSEMIRQIDTDGAVHTWCHGFGRPQGIAFDSGGRLHVCASFEGNRGIFRAAATDPAQQIGNMEQVVSGHGIVGVAFAPDKSMVVATGSSIYRIPAIP